MFWRFEFRGRLTSVTSASSEGAQWIFSKSGRSNEKDEACLSFIREIFTKSVHRGGVIVIAGTDLCLQSDRVDWPTEKKIKIHVAFILQDEMKTIFLKWFKTYCLMSNW